MGVGGVVGRGVGAAVGIGVGEFVGCSMGAGVGIFSGVLGGDDTYDAQNGSQLNSGMGQIQARIAFVG